MSSETISFHLGFEVLKPGSPGVSFETGVGFETGISFETGVGFETGISFETGVTGFSSSWGLGLHRGLHRVVVIRGMLMQEHQQVWYSVPRGTHPPLCCVRVRRDALFLLNPKPQTLNRKPQKALRVCPPSPPTHGKDPRTCTGPLSVPNLPSHTR